jgi:translation initiation factor 2B subunit (eIF-2B alpha/beta/delta family)
VVFAVLAVFFAMLSATTAQRVKQLARELEETRKRLREADASNASQSNGTLP